MRWNSKFNAFFILVFEIVSEDKSEWVLYFDNRLLVLKKVADSQSKRQPTANIQGLASNFGFWTPNFSAIKKMMSLKVRFSAITEKRSPEILLFIS